MVVAEPGVTAISRRRQMIWLEVAVSQLQSMPAMLKEQGAAICNRRRKVMMPCMMRNMHVLSVSPSLGIEKPSLPYTCALHFFKARLHFPGH